MGLKEIVILGVLGATALDANAQNCPTRCEFPQLMTCTQGTEEIRPRLKRQGGEQGVDSYFIKTAENPDGSYEHLSYIPEAEVVAATRFKKGWTGATIDLSLDFAPYGSVDEVYRIEKNWIAAIKFGTVSFPNMLAEAKTSGDPVAYLKKVLAQYRVESDKYESQVKYDDMMRSAMAAVCVTKTGTTPTN